jgi:mannose-6-phosphate isomerase-like protein (cupin superfamily)
MRQKRTGDQPLRTGTTTCLDGRVTVVELPSYPDPPSAVNAPVSKRLSLPQGELAQFWDSDEGMRYIAGIEILPGAIRGNHYHQHKAEVIYVLTGKALLAVKDPLTHEQASFELHPGYLARIKQGVAHALKGIEAGFAVECSSTRFDPADVVRHPAI